MAANASFTVQDGENTPVNHVFDPVNIDGNTAYYQNKTANTFDGRETYSLQHKVGQVVRTVNTQLRKPREINTAEAGDPVYEVVDFGVAKATFLIPKTWTVQQAENLRVEFANSLLATAVLNATDGGEFVW